MTPAKNLLRGAASVRVTLVLLGVTAVVAVAGDGAPWPVGIWIALPIGALVINLIAALITNATIRAKPALFAFHFALASLALLVGLDRLMALSGHVEVTEGAAFEARLADVEAGPLHTWRLNQVGFVQGPFDIGYAPGMKRRQTYSRVAIEDGKGGWRETVVGDDRPLVAHGYRFYTSFNKGFAPVVSFRDTNGLAHTGAVHLPSYPLNDFQQGNDWNLPGSGRTIKLWLSLDVPVYDEDGPWSFETPKTAKLVVIDGAARHELALGQSVALADGTVRFEELRTWMGYTISSNRLIIWILATAVVATLAMAAHVFTKLRGPLEVRMPAGAEVSHAD